MKYVEWIGWSGIMLTAAGLALAGWRPPAAPAGIDADGPLWWKPEAVIQPGAALTIFRVSVSAAGTRLQPGAQTLDLDSLSQGFRFLQSDMISPLSSPAPIPMMPQPPPQADAAGRFWTPDADAFDILGPRRQGREAGWLEQDVATRQEAATRDREPAGMLGLDTLWRPGASLSDGASGILRRESIFDD